MSESAWIDVKDRLPRGPDSPQGWRNLIWFYVLATDAKNRMSVGYIQPNGVWTFAKPIGVVTHWMPLPKPAHPTNELNYNET